MAPEECSMQRLAEYGPEKFLKTKNTSGCKNNQEQAATVSLSPAPLSLPVPFVFLKPEIYRSLLRLSSYLLRKKTEIPAVFALPTNPKECYNRTKWPWSVFKNTFQPTGMRVWQKAVFKCAPRFKGHAGMGGHDSEFCKKYKKRGCP